MYLRFLFVQMHIDNFFFQNHDIKQEAYFLLKMTPFLEYSMFSLPPYKWKYKSKKRLLCQLLYTLTSTPFTSLFEMYKSPRALRKMTGGGDHKKESKKLHHYEENSQNNALLGLLFLYDILTSSKCSPRFQSSPRHTS